MQETTEHKNLTSEQGAPSTTTDEEPIFMGDDETAVEEECDSSRTLAPNPKEEAPSTIERDDDEEEAQEDEDDEKDTSLMSKEHVFSILMRAMDIDGQWFKRNLGFMLVLTICLLAYVTNRYQAQKELIEESKLRSELKDARYRSLTKASELTLKTRQSNIEAMLRQQGDTTLRARSESPYLIKVPKKNNPNDSTTETTR